MHAPPLPKVRVVESWLLLSLLSCWYSCQSAKLQWMWWTTRGEKGGRVSIRYNADSNLHLIIKVLRFKRLAVAVNSNGLTQSRAVCFPVPPVPSGELSAFCAYVPLSAFRRGQRCKGERLTLAKALSKKTDSTGTGGGDGRHRCWESIPSFSLFIADKKRQSAWVHISTSSVFLTTQDFHPPFKTLRVSALHFSHLLL